MHCKQHSRILIYDVDGGYAPNGKEEGQMQMEMFKEDFLLAGEMLAGLLEMGKVWENKEEFVWFTEWDSLSAHRNKR